MSTPAEKPTIHPLLRDGYRPFFFSAMVFAAVTMAAWLIDFLQGPTMPSIFGTGHWHGHEMLFGFTLAFFAGFLLHACRNWTGVMPLGSSTLLALALLWLAGRLIHFFPDLIPAQLAAIPDLLFPLLLTAVVAASLSSHRVSHAYAIVEVSTIISISAIFNYWDVTGWQSSHATHDGQLTLYASITLLVVLAGKLIPGFTEKTLNQEIPIRRYDGIIENTAIAMLYLMMVLLFIFPDGGTVPALITSVAAIANGLRLKGWYCHEIWQYPMLWVLYCGYGWIIAGLLLIALGMAGATPLASGWHALGVGGIAVLTTGMMARVLLTRHEEKRPPDSWVVLAFILLNIAAVSMTMAPLTGQTLYQTMVLISGLSWIGAFGVMSWRFYSSLLSA